MSPPEIAQAKQHCTECPVRRSCLQDGLDEEWGIWGGYTRPERKRALDSVQGDPDLVMVAYDAGTLDIIAILR